MPSQRRVNLLLCLITLFALFIRIQYVNQTEIDHPIRADAREYVIYGYNLYSHGVFSKEITSGKPTPDSFRSPGYPFLISLAFLIGGKQAYYPLVIMAQTIMGALLVPFTFWIGMRFLSLSWVFLAAMLVAISPHLIAMTSYVLTETLLGFLVLSTVYFFTVAVEKKRLHYFLISGLLSGAAYLTNETFFCLPFLLVIFFLYCIYGVQSEKPSKKIAGYISVYMIVFLIFSLAWTWRSHNIESNRLKGSGRAVLSLSHGAYPDFIYKDKKYKYYPYLEDPMQPAFGANLKSFLKILAERFQEKPLRYIRWYVFEKPYYFWSWDNLQSQMGGKHDQGEGDVYVYKVNTSLYYNVPLADLSRIGMKYLHPLLLVAALTGVPVFIIGIRRKTGMPLIINAPGLLFIVLVYYTFLYTVFAPWPRYSVPLRPELYLFALWALKKSIDYLAQKYRVQNRLA